MAVRNYSSTTPITTLTAPIGPADVTLTIAASSSSFPPVPFTILIAPDTVNEEVVDVTAAVGSTLTVVRGVDGTTAKSHAAGTSVIHGVSARDFQEANDFINNPPSGVKFQDTAPTSPQDGEVWIDSDSTVTLLNPNDYLEKATAEAKGDLLVGTGSASITRLPVAADDYLLMPSATEATGVKWSNLLRGVINLAPEERCNVVASAASGTVNLDARTAGVWYYTANATANHTLNIRGSAASTLSSLLAVGDSITVVWLVTNGATPYMPTVIQIDGTTVTPKWSGGVAPAAGNASSIDAYSFTIIKTASAPTYTVLAGQAKFA